MAEISEDLIRFVLKGINETVEKYYADGFGYETDWLRLDIRDYDGGLVIGDSRDYEGGMAEMTIPWAVFEDYEAWAQPKRWAREQQRREVVARRAAEIEAQERETLAQLLAKYGKEK